MDVCLVAFSGTNISHVVSLLLLTFFFYGKIVQFSLTSKTKQTFPSKKEKKQSIEKYCAPKNNFKYIAKGDEINRLKKLLKSTE